MKPIRTILLLITAFTQIAAAPPTRNAAKIIYDDGSEQAIAATQPVTPATEPDLPSRPPQEPLANQSRLGVNLDTPDSNSSFFLYADASKSAWEVGANGGPLNQVVFVEQPAAQGVYKVVTEKPTSLRAGAVGGERKDVPGGVALVHDVTVAPGQASLQLLYSAEPGTVAIWRPGYGDHVSARGPPSSAPPAPPVFTNEALAQLKPFGRIRFMDLLATNGNRLKSWSERPLLSDASWATARGAPLEVPILLGNQAGKDIWINFPVDADDDYIKSAGELVDTNLRSDVFPYGELGNENWNTADKFAIGRGILLNKARAAIAAGDVSLTAADEAPGFPSGLRPDGKARNETYALYRYTARRAVEIKQLLPPRFRMILSGQDANSNVLRIQLEYVAKYHGPPKEFFYAIASAPYFGLSAADQERAGLSKEQVSEMLVAASNPSPERRAAHRALATKYELRYVGYEGGAHLHRAASAQAVVDAQSLPRTGEAYEKYFSNVLAEGGCDEFYQFVLGSNWGWKQPKIVPPATQPGPVKDVSVWGLTPGTHATSPKYDAAARVAAAMKGAKP